MTGKKTKEKKKMNLRDLLIVKLEALYDIERTLVIALPKLAAKANDQHLKAAFRNHLDETRAHVERLKEAFRLLGEKAIRLKAEAIRGLTKDAAWVMKNIKGAESRDAALIGAASYVEHYEMAGYQSAVKWADELGEQAVSEILAETLREEMDAADRLMELAVTKIDRKSIPREKRSHYQLIYAK